MSKILELKILIGHPYTGKTTWSKGFLEDNPKWFRVSRDDIRGQNFIDQGKDKFENLITNIVNKQIHLALANGFNVIYDATSCNSNYINNFIDKFNSLCDISFKVFDVLSDEEIDNRQRNRLDQFVPFHIVKSFRDNQMELMESFNFAPRKKINVNINNIKLVTERQKESVIICDIDGTLAFNPNRSMYNPTNEEILNDEVCDQVKLMLHSLGKDYRIIICSGRSDKYYNITKQWLTDNKIPYFKLIMRKTNDYRPDYIVKKEILDEIKKNYNVLFAIDDRKCVKQMWVENGVFVFDVNQHDLIF